MQIVVLLFMVGLSLPSSSASAQSILRLEERFVLQSSTGESSLGDPRFVQAAPNGRIHVFDLLSMQAKVFLPDGTYERSYGGRGRTEGKMLGMSAAYVDAQGRTLVLDQMGARATWFGADGSVASVHPLDAEQILWPRAVIPEGDRLILQYRMPDGDVLLHEWNRDFTQRFRKFGAWRDVPGHDDPFVATLSLLHPGPVVRWGDDLLITPLIYDEGIIAYKRSDPARKRALRGAPLPFDAYEPVAAPDGPRPSDLMIVNADERRAARVRATSLGLMVLPSGHLVRLSMRQEASGKQVYAELFNPQGTLVGVEQIEALAAPGHRASIVPLFVGGTDEAGRLYLVDRRGERPVVRVFNVEVVR